MKKNCIFTFTLLLFLSCNNHKKTDILSHKDIINNDTCLTGFIIIQYRGEVDHPVKSLLIRTDKKDTNYLKYIASKSSMIDSFSRKFELNEIISTKNEFGIIKNFIITHNTQKKIIIKNNQNNSQEVIFIDKCDTLDYIVDREDTFYFKNLENIVNNNDILRKYFKYSRNIQEWRLEGSHN